MWKISIDKIRADLQLNLDTIIHAVDDYNGTFLFTGNNKYYKSRLNIIGLNPVIKIDENTKLSFQDDETYNSFEFIDLLKEFNNTDEFFPLLLGYIGFDFMPYVEEEGLFKGLAQDDFPKFQFSIFEYYIIFNSDNIQGATLYKCNFPFEYNSVNITFKKSNNISNEIKQSFYVDTNMPKSVFISNVERVKKYIHDGDIYQVNLTRQINGTTDYSFEELALKLYHSNNIEFGVIAKINDKFILSTSPERFFKISDNHILTSPIKGTIGKAKNKAENKILIEQLLSNKKELAELAMIVDLLRNDIGKICEYDSVEVLGYPIVKELENVFHLVADIKGKLKTDSFNDIIMGLFPGGSISGCPKIRACQIIEELEKISRGPYTGSFGYISLDGTMDFNILIRTLFYQDKKICFNVGGGITLKSDPVKEYEETIHKASSIWEAINMEYIHDERYCIS